MSGTYQQQVEYRKKLREQPIPEGHKRCKRCLNPKQNADFENESPRTRDGISKLCHECRAYMRSFAKELRKNWTEEQVRKSRERAKHLRDTRKKQVLDAYGGKCACCGEWRIEFLQLDHIVPIGHKKRLETGEWGNRFYLSLIKRNFPQGYRCLCANCNSSLGYFGYCPHQQEKAAA